MKTIEKLDRDETGIIKEGAYCADCGWPILSACVNDEFEEFVKKETVFPDAEWWLYCVNKGCRNHKGEEDSQTNSPKWVSY